MRKANEIQQQEVVLSPKDVLQQFPNAMMATINKDLVFTATQAHKQIRVFYYDAIWGRTVLSMEIC